MSPGPIYYCLPLNGHPGSGHKLTSGNHRKPGGLVSAEHLDPTGEHLAKSDSFWVGRYKFNRYLGRNHCPVYWWKTVCQIKSSLGTFEDVWQNPVPNSDVCWEKNLWAFKNWAAKRLPPQKPVNGAAWHVPLPKRMRGRELPCLKEMFLLQELVRHSNLALQLLWSNLRNCS